MVEVLGLPHEFLKLHVAFLALCAKGFLPSFVQPSVLLIGSLLLRR
jgi:hypothetical protein